MNKVKKGGSSGSVDSPFFLFRTYCSWSCLYFSMDLRYCSRSSRWSGATRWRQRDSLPFPADALAVTYRKRLEKTSRRSYTPYTFGRQAEKTVKEPRMSRSASTSETESATTRFSMSGSCSRMDCEKVSILTDFDILTSSPSSISSFEDEDLEDGFIEARGCSQRTP